MSLTIVATPGSATANSFVTLDYAVTYLDGRLNAEAFTDAATVDLQNRALVEATLELSLLERLYTGTRVDGTQALSWPRQYAVDPDAPSPVDPADVVWPVYFDDDEIPSRLEKATVELALEFLRAGTADIANPDADLKAGLIRKKVDVLEWEWDRSSPEARREGLTRFPRVHALIAPLFSEAAVGGLDVVRV